jgi:polyhydroxybutyrate depolymerase
MQGRILALVCAMGVFLSAAVCGQPASGQSTRTIQSGGGERSYLLHVPAGYAGEAISLVLNFHGSGGAPGNQLATSGFDALADAEGFAVAFPAGVFANSVSQRSWNANLDPGVDDVQFARDVIADVSATLNIDPSRIYATGFSGGARMTSRLACELADILAAAAPVAGLQYPDGCTPVHGVPILANGSRNSRRSLARCASLRGPRVGQGRRCECRAPQLCTLPRWVGGWFNRDGRWRSYLA